MKYFAIANSKYEFPEKKNKRHSVIAIYEVKIEIIKVPGYTDSFKIQLLFTYPPQFKDLIKIFKDNNFGPTQYCEETLNICLGFLELIKPRFPKLNGIRVDRLFNHCNNEFGAIDIHLTIAYK
jgi:hypothetical protein